MVLTKCVVSYGIISCIGVLVLLNFVRGYLRRKFLKQQQLLVTGQETVSASFSDIYKSLFPLRANEEELKSAPELQKTYRNYKITLAASWIVVLILALLYAYVVRNFGTDFKLEYC
jgi:hypothetical protein